MGVDPRSMIDFSANINPFGPSPKAVAALAKVPLDRYPDCDALDLRRVLAERLDVSTEHLIAGNGSGELLQLLGLVYLRPEDTVLIVGPTYSEYARIAVAMGARWLSCQATAQTDFAVPVKSATEMLRAVRPRMAFVCNPNNPTGQLFPTATIREWAEELDQTLFIVDEAYIEFVSETQSLAGTEHRNVIVLRSLTKAYSLAGLRLGYIVADPEIIQLLCRVRTPWNVNAAAQAAGAAAVQDNEHQERSLMQLHDAKQTLIADLRSLGLNPLPSMTPFFLVRVGDACRSRSALIRARVLVRDCTSFGLSEFIRIGTRTPVDNSKLAEAFAGMRSMENF
ncbi:MAG: histidinol-phosphate aminotransferase family protein [Acidobacteria bacterium]|nr:histidinol-phosphate aminotransferase family protein [Acidobacteriota bacterium]